MLEYFLKNDDLHDPFVNDDDLVALDVCTREDLAESRRSPVASTKP